MREQPLGPPRPPSSDSIPQGIAPKPRPTKAPEVAISDKWIGSPINNDDIKQLFAKAGIQCTRVGSMRGRVNRVVIIAEIMTKEKI